MDIFELILSRRTVLNYTSQAVPQALLDKALLAAIHAPNHKLTWPWRFYFTGPKTRRQLADLQVEAKAKKSPEPMSDAMKKSMIEKFMTPAELLILGIKKSEDPDRAKEDYASLACAVQNMSLVFAAEGVGTKWGTGNVTRSDKTYEILGLNKNEVDLCGFFWIGHAAGPVRKPERPPVTNFVKRLD